MSASADTGPLRPQLTLTARCRLEQERERLRQERQELAGSLRSRDDPPGDSGDQSKFIEGSDELTRLDDRIDEITDQLDHSDTVEEPPDGVVAVGTEVTVQYADGTTDTLRVGDIVEDDGEGTLVTPDSPLGQALLGQRVGDSVTYTAPDGRFRAQVVGIGKVR